MAGYTRWNWARRSVRGGAAPRRNPAPVAKPAPAADPAEPEEPEEPEELDPEREERMAIGKARFMLMKKSPDHPDKIALEAFIKRRRWSRLS